jgi:hypothetical protein
MENPVAKLAEHILETLNETFAAAGVALPSLQFFTLGGEGASTHLCEQVTVSVEQLYSGTPESQAQTPVRCDGPRTVSFAVELVRCAPTGTVRGRSTPLPVQEDANQQSTVAFERMQDMELLLRSGMYACAATWFQTGIVDVSAAPPNGGFQSLVMSISTVPGGQ